MQTKSLALEVKWLEEPGAFEGVAAGYGNVDLGGDVIEPGAFAASLQEHKASGTKPALLWQHDQTQPIGVVDSFEETPAGLAIKGRLNLDVAKGAEAYSLVKQGAMQGLSIGYRTLKTRNTKGIRKILSAWLGEISFVTVPMNPLARVTSMKAAAAAERHTMNEEIDGAVAESTDVEAKLAMLEGKAAKIDELETKLADAVKRSDDLELKLARPGVITSTRDSRADLERKAFNGFIRGGRESLDHIEAKSLRVADDSAGGFLAPAQFLAELDRNLTLLSPIRSVARVAQTNAGSVQIPRRTAEMSCVWVGENETRSETGPSYGQAEIFVHELAGYVDVSVKLLEDAAVDVEAELARDFAEDFALREGTAFISGNGVKRPEGILQNSDVASVNSGAATAVTADGLIGLFYALKSPYRGASTWVMNAATLAAVRRLKDGQGQYLWQQGLAPGQPESLLGRPIIECPDMPDVGAGTYPIAIGDFASGFRIFDKPAVSLLRDPYSQATAGMVRFHGRKRVGAAVVRPESIKKMFIAA